VAECLEHGRPTFRLHGRISYCKYQSGQVAGKVDP